MELCHSPLAKPFQALSSPHAKAPPTEQKQRQVFLVLPFKSKEWSQKSLLIHSRAGAACSV